MRLAFVQTSPTLGATRRNLEEAHSLIERVRDADLLVLPELFHSGYAVRSADEARSLAVAPDQSSEPVAMCIDAARQFRMAIVAGFLEAGGLGGLGGSGGSGKLYNSAFLIDASGVVAKYRKRHLFDRELDIFEPGSDPSPVTKLPGDAMKSPGDAAKSSGARIGMQICFDWAFPEDWGRLAWGTGDGTGAQVIAHPVNLVLPDACPLAIRARALENRIYVVCAGRVGVDQGPSGEIVFRAGSRIVGPDGAVLAAGPDDRPGVDMVNVDITLADDKWMTPRNHVLKERFPQTEDSGR